jgi:putative ABC transport system ATP-binding protein
MWVGARVQPLPNSGNIRTWLWPHRFLVVKDNVPRQARTGEHPVVRLRQVTKIYREGDQQRVVFRGLDATIERNELIVLLGRSGSGKSTLLNLIGGIDLPTAGEVLVNDVELTGLSETERTLFRRRDVGFVFQFFNLIPTLTVAENLYLPLELNRKLDAAGHQQVAQLLQQIGLADRGTSYPDRLSGGEQQRVAIARALVHRPSLLLADEPTGNLDRESGRQILVFMQQMARAAGATLIMVSHSSEALRIADRGFVLDDGQLVPLAAAQASP